MGVFSKLMDSMRIDNGDDYDYDDDYDYEDEAPRTSIFRRNKSNDDYDDVDDEPKGGIFSKKNNNNIQPVRKGMEVTMVKPTAVEDSRTICDLLLTGKAVVLNMEGIPTELAQRIIDFTSGATYSMSGKLQKISDFIFIATPEQVDLSGDFQDLLNAKQFDMNGSGFRF